MTAHLVLLVFFLIEVVVGVGYPGARVVFGGVVSRLSILKSAGVGWEGISAGLLAAH